MTEKRFIMVKCIYDQWCIVDKALEDDQIILLAKSKPNVTYIVDLLNDLHKENQSLKFQLDECRNKKLFSRRQLEKENEQLKQDVDYFNKTYEVQERGLNIVPAMCTISSPTPSRRELFEENEKLKQELKDCHKSNHEYYVDKDKLIRLCEEHNIDWTKVIK